MTPEHTELVQRLREAANIIQAQAERIVKLEKALKPFVKIKPSTFYPADGSENEEYIVTIRTPWSNPADFTGADLARARTALKGSDDQ